MTCYATDQYVLVFGTTTLGAHIHSHTAVPKLVDSPRVRNNFWSSEAIIDGGYPAIYWEHTFLCYFEADDRITFTNTYYHQATVLSTSTDTLTVFTDSTSTPLFCYGQCTPASVDQAEPQELLLHAAGIFRFVFLSAVQTPVKLN